MSTRFRLPRVDWKWVRANILKVRSDLAQNMLLRATRSLQSWRAARKPTFSTQKLVVGHNLRPAAQGPKQSQSKNLIIFLETKTIRIRKTSIQKMAHKEHWNTKRLSPRQRWQTECHSLLASRDCTVWGRRHRLKLAIWTATQFWNRNSCHFLPWVLQKAQSKSTKWAKVKRRRCPTARSRTSRTSSEASASRLAPMNCSEFLRIPTSPMRLGSKSCKY